MYTSSNDPLRYFLEKQNHPIRLLKVTTAIFLTIEMFLPSLPQVFSPNRFNGIPFQGGIKPAEPLDTCFGTKQFRIKKGNF